MKYKKKKDIWELKNLKFMEKGFLPHAILKKILE